MGPGGMPIMPMVPGAGAGSGGGKDRELVTAKMTPDQIKLRALDTIAEAVQGGTIAQKRDDAA